MANRKSFGVALLIWFFLGGIGGHRIYIKEKVSVILWYWLLVIITLSIILWIDLFKLKSMIDDTHALEKARNL
jgi:TM2 domain-containing membrane protein YozV